MTATRVVVSIVASTATILVSGAYTRAESSATICTRPSFNPQTNTAVPGDWGLMATRWSTDPPQLTAGRAIMVSLTGNTERKTVIAAESGRLSVTGTGTPPTRPTARESVPHCNSSGGAETTCTSVESQ